LTKVDFKNNFSNTLEKDDKTEIGFLRKTSIVFWAHAILNDDEILYV